MTLPNSMNLNSYNSVSKKNINMNISLKFILQNFTEVRFE